jgi:hypothetical protein
MRLKGETKRLTPERGGRTNCLYNKVLPKNELRLIFESFGCLNTSPCNGFHGYTFRIIGISF